MADLKKSLGFFQLLALGVAGVIGSSWIYTNSAFFTKYGAGGMIFGLLLGTALAACVALAYSELTSLFPRAGGEVVYAYTILGRAFGFVTGWLLIGAYMSSTAFYVTAFGLLLGKFMPVMDQYPLYSIAGEAVTAPVLLAGVILTLLIFALNWFGVEVGGQVQVILFATMMVIGLALITVGLGAGSPSNFWPPYRPDQNAVADTLRFVVPGMTYMAGFGLVAVLAEDANLPPKKIASAVVLTVLTAGAFYSLVLLSSAWVLPWEQVAQMDLGTIDAFRVAGFPLLGWGAFAVAILGLLTSFLGLFIATSRIVVAMGRAGLLPASLAEVHAGSGVPRRALVFVATVTLALGWLGKGAVVWFLDTGGIYLGLVWILVVTAKYALPKKYPHLASKRRFNASWVPAVGALGAAAIIVLTLLPNTNMALVWPAEYIILAMWLIIGGILFAVSAKVPRDRALDALLGEYKETLDADRSSVTE
ncbi:APC family permease [Gephyromycinifex aptenodytis]|uniref:APC family permease n=1 Tax=Gephyromycinifex aptenodytis TaxID=2716227 RepID=UPI0014469BAC|nr:APC family permease [Gephyromycinifex aptenodytis]